MRKFINIISLLAIIIVSSCKKEDDLIPVAKITFKESYISDFKAISLNCEVKSNVTIETLHIEYSTTKEMESSNKIELHLVKDNLYTVEISGLEIETEYYYRYIVGNKVSEFFDDQKRSFKTLDYTSPVVLTGDALDISGTKATLNGTIEFACDKPILEKGFMIGCSEKELKEYKVEGDQLLLNVNDLDYKTLYYYRAYAKNEIGVGVGEIKTFETCSAVSFKELEVHSITATSAIVEGGISDNGGIEVEIQGLRYAIKGTDNVSFIETTTTASLSALQHDTTYEIWGYAKTFEGEFEGSHVEFKTKDGKVIITTSTPADVTTSSAILKGSITSDGGSKIIERGFCYSLNDTPTVNNTKLKVDGETGEYETLVKNLPQNVRYNVRAYAINGINTYYGESVSFTTLYDSATFGTITSSDITASSISVTCAITSNGGSTITQCGFCYSTYKNPTVDDNVALVTNSKTNLSTTIKGLKSGVTYYVRAFATNANSTFYSDEISFVTCEGVIQFSDPTTTNIAAASIIVSSNVLTAGGGTITERGFCYSTAKNPTTQNNCVKVSGTTGEYTSTLTNLQNKTIYYIRAYAINESGTYYSGELTVKTQDGVATLTTTDATNIKAQSATINGEIVSDGGSNITERGFCYSTVQSPTTESNCIKIEGTTGAISHVITELTNSTTYYVRTYAKNSYGTHYGNQKSFTTSSGVATFDDITISSITVSSATLTSQITSDGNSSITQRGFCYSTSSNPTVSDHKVTVSGTTGNLTGNLTGLTNGQKYYIRAYATNAISTHYGKQTSFTTLTGLADVTTHAATDVKAESATLNGNVASANGGTISSRGFCFSTSVNPSISNSKISVSGTTGTMSKEATSLTPGTQYYARAYVTTQFGTTYGEQVSFVTKDGVVIFNTIDKSNVLANSANLSASIATNGGSDIIEKGFCYSTTATPTTADNKITESGSSNNYSCLLTNLACSTTYRIRAYAKNNINTYYSDEISIMTDTGIATLAALTINNIGQTTLDLQCSILDDGGTDILSRGFCYSINGNPTISSEKVVVEGTTGNMSGTITGLISDHDYYVKAFVETRYGITYSDPIKIHTVAGLATLSNSEVIQVNETTAKIRAELVSKGGVEIVNMGYCYGTNPSPTINDNLCQFMSEVGTFECTITKLEQFTTYYARPYATTMYGTTYGDQVSFTTTYYPVEFGQIKVSALSPTNSYINCPIINYGNNEVIEQGVCYSISPNPTISEMTYITTSDSNDKVVVLTGLTPNTTYYAKRYVKNKISLFYSDEISFTTINVPTGAVAGLFSVSETSSVYIASGNMWIYSDYKTIAPEQYAITKNNPFNYPMDVYRSQSNFEKEVSDVVGLEGTWRALSKEEWEYLINGRDNATNLRKLAYIDGVKGLLIFPDNWHEPENITIINELEELSVENWGIYESAGVVFLPATGLYVAKNWTQYNLMYAGELGRYCSSSPKVDKDDSILGPVLTDGYYYLEIPAIKVEQIFAMSGDGGKREPFGAIRLVQDYVEE